VSNLLAGSFSREHRLRKAAAFDMQARAMDRASGLLDVFGGRLEVLCLLDAASLGRVVRCSKAARVAVEDEWRSWDGRFRAFDATHLESELVGLWSRYGQSMSQLPMKKPRSASDVYRLWPSCDWFKEGELPFTDHIQFEQGDSSYNLWILDLPTALPLLGRLVSDLYLRANSGAVFEMKRRNDAPGAAEFLKALKALHEPKDSFMSWELQMRPCAELMRQINWDDEKQSWLLRGRSRAEFEEVLQRRPWLRHGPLLPRSPQPVHGLSLWWGQESAFMTWDRKELWIYGCYMD